MLVNWHLLINAEHRKTSSEILGLPLLWNKGTLELKVSGSSLAHPALVTPSVCHDGFVSIELLLPLHNYTMWGFSSKAGFFTMKTNSKPWFGADLSLDCLHHLIWGYSLLFMPSNCHPPCSWKSSWTPEGNLRNQVTCILKWIWNWCWFILTDLGITAP